MKLFGLLSLILVSSVYAQTTATVTVNGKNTTKDFVVTLLPKTIISSFTCNLTAMEPGETSLCTITISQAARTGGYPISISIPAGFTAPGSVLIPTGTTSTTFLLVRNDIIAAISNQIDTLIWTVSAPNFHQSFAAVAIPCCARVDHCRLEISEPCKGVAKFIPDNTIRIWNSQLNFKGPAKYGWLFSEYQENPILTMNFESNSSPEWPVFYSK